jgi:hypothetical protein
MHCGLPLSSWPLFALEDGCPHLFAVRVVQPRGPRCSPQDGRWPVFNESLTGEKRELFSDP